MRRPPPRYAFRVKRRTLLGWLLPDTESADQPVPSQRRLRKMGALLLVLIGVCGFALVVGALQGAWRSGIGTAVVLTVSLLGLLALRRGVALEVVTPAVLGTGVLVAAVMAMAAGRDGMHSVFWMALAPLIALAVGGRRAGWSTLFFTVAIIAVTMVGIEQHWLSSFLAAESSLTRRMVGLLGACVAAFLLTRAYETETEASIRALETQNQALLDARAEAERANRAKSEFLATISHEIRTPLNGVTGMAMLLGDETDPARVREGLRVIQQSADTLLAVINDVLDLSKIESNHLELEAVPLSPASELRGVMDLLQSRAAERHNELELKVDPDVPAWIRGDPTRLRQVAMNLISNAVKFTSQGRVSVRLGLHDGRLLLEVTDTGIGLSAEALARVFQPFAQADTSTTRRFGGTGLGLVISRRLLDAMGGTVSVQSEPGRGSCFTVSLPVVLADAPLAAPVVAPDVSPRKSVLLVEDNFVNQVVATRLLEKLGHTVTVAGDGAKALELSRLASFDLVLMDCHMPVMDGFEATRELRRDGCQWPIFALTAAVTTEDRDRCLAAGMTGVLTKPLRLERLRAVLRGDAAELALVG